ncbi:MAG: hypothetical protein ACREJX_15375, partial [Polyangiaceae bacterium]
MNRVWVWCCLVIFLLAGCGGASSSSLKASSPQGGAASSSAPDFDQAPADVEPAPPPATAAPTSESSSRSASGSTASLEPAQPAPSRERPGLGTQWGETRSSFVQDVSFDRADDSHPFALASLHYNDLGGVTQLAAFHDAKAHSFHEVPTAGGAISVSIVGEN